VGLNTMDLCKQLARPIQTLATSPSQISVTPKGTTPIIRQVNLEADEDVDDYLDVEIDAGRVKGELVKPTVSGSDTEEDTIHSDEGGRHKEPERLCPSALIMAGRMSSINTASQSLRGSVLGIISASKKPVAHNVSQSSRA